MKLVFAFMFAFVLLQPAFAHHSLSIHYRLSADDLIEGEGVIKKISPRNPHTFMVVSSVDAQGKAVDWVLQMPSKNQLLRMGWHFEDVQPGTKVRFTGFPAIKDSPAAILQFLYLPEQKLCAAHCQSVDELSLLQSP